MGVSSSRSNPRDNHQDRLPAAALPLEPAIYRPPTRPRRPALTASTPFETGDNDFGEVGLTMKLRIAWVTYQWADRRRSARSARHRRPAPTAAIGSTAFFTSGTADYRQACLMGRISLARAEILIRK